jgi:hypothetical protein
VRPQGDALRNAAGSGIRTRTALTKFSASNWLALLLPHGTSAALVPKLNSATVATIGTPVIRVRIQEIGANLVAPDCRSPNYLQKFAEIDTTGVSMD